MPSFVRRRPGFWAVCLTCFVATHAAIGNTAAASRPNVLLLLVDDLGWADLGCYGSELHRTPHIDALAASGMRYTQAYAACPVCSPTRASIMTGRHPVQVGITDWIPGMDASRRADRRFEHVDDLSELPASEKTLAEYLREANYQNAFFGKWHLGGEGSLPTDHGFDHNVGGDKFGSPPGGYHAPFRNPRLPEVPEGTYLPTLLTDELIRWVDDRDPARPFFAMLSYYNVHTPIQPDRRTVEDYRQQVAQRFVGPTPTLTFRDVISRGRQDNPEYASMVTAVDSSVGRLMEMLDASGLTKNTMVVFYSDNGGLCTLPPRRRVGQTTGSETFVGGPTCNLPLRSGKGWLYEGGIREPAIIRMPAENPPRDVTEQVISSCDILPTVLAACGIEPNAETELSGIDVMSEDARHQPRTLHWHYPHYHGSGWTPGAAIRDGDWKLIEFYEWDAVELYNLAKDPGESRDVAGEHPEITQRLRDRLFRWQAEQGAKLPEPIH